MAIERNEDMPKITVYGGPSNRFEDGPVPDGQDEAEVRPHNESEDEDEYERWPFAALRTEAKERGLSAGGTAADLAARLREDDEAH